MATSQPPKSSDVAPRERLLRVLQANVAQRTWDQFKGTDAVPSFTLDQLGMESLDCVEFGLDVEREFGEIAQDTFDRLTVPTARVSDWLEYVERVA